MSVLHIKDFPDDLHKEIRRLMVEDGTTIRELVVEGMSEYIDKRKAQAKAG